MPPMLHTHVVPLACIAVVMDSVNALSTRKKMQHRVKAFSGTSELNSDVSVMDAPYSNQLYMCNNKKNKKLLSPPPPLQG